MLLLTVMNTVLRRYPLYLLGLNYAATIMSRKENAGCFVWIHLYLRGGEEEKEEDIIVS